MVVIIIEYHYPGICDKTVQLRLRLYDALKTSESLYMGNSYIGDYSKIGICYLTQLIYISLMTCAHLNNKDLGIRRGR